LLPELFCYTSNMKRKQRELAIDFDDTIYNHGQPMSGVAYALQELLDRGYRLVIHTLRARTSSGKAYVVEWMDRYDLPYHEVTAIKPDAILYIDNRALRFTTWTDALQAIDLYDPLSVLE
jgi:uncharacterized protein (DUF1786 family)